MNIGGIANYILSLSGAFRDKGAEVLIASSGGNLEDELKKIGITNKHLDIKTKFEFSPKVLKSAFILSKIIRDAKVDIVHAHTRVSQVSALLASRMTKVPLVTTCHGFFKKRSRGVFDTWGVKVIAISDAVKSHLIDDLGLKKERIEVIYSGIDAGRFLNDYPEEDKDRIKKELALKDGPVIGTIGRLSPVKGQKFLIHALKEIISKQPDVQALIIGDGPEEGVLRNLAKSLEIADSVHFFASSLDTHKFLSVMDVFIFPSIKEGLGMALLEAMASGKACVASDIGGIGNIMKSGANGVLVEVGDTTGISDAILILLQDAELRERIGQNARALVKEKFSLLRWADEVMRFYERVLRDRVKA